jgi:hypothetical protein
MKYPYVLFFRHPDYSYIDQFIDYNKNNYYFNLLCTLQFNHDDFQTN